METRTETVRKASAVGQSERRCMHMYELARTFMCNDGAEVQCDDGQLGRLVGAWAGAEQMVLVTKGR